MLKVAILTVSDKGSRGEREDLSGQAIREAVALMGAEIVAYRIVPDEQDQIALALMEWADGGVADIIITTGGTGIAPRDVTPEATRSVIERELPGVAEAMRAESLKKTPRAMLSRAVAGTRRGAVILNLPGSPKAVRECLEVVLPTLPHAIEMLQSRPSDHS